MRARELADLSAVLLLFLPLLPATFFANSSLSLPALCTHWLDLTKVSLRTRMSSEGEREGREQGGVGEAHELDLELEFSSSSSSETSSASHSDASKTSHSTGGLGVTAESYGMGNSSSPPSPGGARVVPSRQTRKLVSASSRALLAYRRFSFSSLGSTPSLRRQEHGPVHQKDRGVSRFVVFSFSLFPPPRSSC